MSNREHRAERRIACEGHGKICYQNIWHPLEVMDVGPGGGRLRVSLTVWSYIREADPIEGWLEIEGLRLNFTGRIRWSALSRRDVQFGYQFLKADGEQLKAIMDYLATFELDMDHLKMPAT